MAEPTGLRWPVHGKRLDVSYPYIDAEVTWACRREYACTAVDVIARRTRLSFLNAEASLEALPKVIDIMAREHKWSSREKERQFKAATTFLQSMGLSDARVGKLTLDDVRHGRQKEHLKIEDEVLARTIFTSDELSTLKDKFSNMDGKSRVPVVVQCRHELTLPFVVSQPTRTARSRLAISRAPCATSARKFLGKRSSPSSAR